MDCDALTCDYVLTYNVSQGDIANFEMSATAGWVAIGFSSDDRMVCIIQWRRQKKTFRVDVCEMGKR